MPSPAAISPPAIRPMHAGIREACWAFAATVAAGLATGGFVPGVETLGPRPHAVAIIASRDRDSQEVELRRHWLREFAPGQAADFTILFIEQFDAQLFNRGWSLNVGLSLVLGLAGEGVADDGTILGSLAAPEESTLSIGDVDTLPLGGVDYTSCAHPTVLSTVIDRYPGRVGGTCGGGWLCARGEFYKHVNGFSNLFWGHGDEDNDFKRRVRAKGRTCKKADQEHGRFKTLLIGHTPRKQRGGYGAAKAELASTFLERLDTDGLSSVRYRVLSVSSQAEVAEGLTPGTTRGVRFVHVRARMVGVGSAGPVAGAGMLHLGGVQVAALTDSGSAWKLVPVGSLAFDVAGILRAAGGRTLIAVDRKSRKARIANDAVGNTVLAHLYRQFDDPASDAFLIADPREPEDVRAWFETRGQYRRQRAVYQVCHVTGGDGGSFVYRGRSCDDNQYKPAWKPEWYNRQQIMFSLEGYAGYHPGDITFALCANLVKPIQRLARGEDGCNADERHPATLYVPAGDAYCVIAPSSPPDGSPVQTRVEKGGSPACASPGWSQVAQFGELPPARLPPVPEASASGSDAPSIDLLLGQLGHSASGEAAPIRPLLELIDVYSACKQRFECSDTV